MPICFQLFPIGSDQPALLLDVDVEICNLFGDAVHPTKYCRHWFDSIGFPLAKGNSFDEIIAYFSDKANHPEEYPAMTAEETKEWCDERVKIAQFLKERYTPNSWTEIGRRD